MAKLKDSGERREFESGAVRDIQEGKGRCDLLPLKIISKVILFNKKHDIYIIPGEDAFMLSRISCFIHTKDDFYIISAISHFIKQNYSDFETAILELSKHYEDGSRKYGDRNWEKGIPYHCFIDSGIRHYIKFLRGDQDEPHDRAFLWNMFGLLWTIENKPEMDDMNDVKIDKYYRDPERDKYYG